MSRKLASVQKIISTEPIEGADRIEIARVLGWQCVTQKSNNFKSGDLVCYFEIDSLLPLSTPQFAFLRKKPEETHGRIKTIKLKGKIAQGLILPLDLITEVLHTQTGGNTPIVYNEGDDLTEALNILKWEPDTSNFGEGAIGGFPSFISKTDETRIQALPQILDQYRGIIMYSTEKLDGASTTIFYLPRDYPGIPTRYLDGNKDQFIFGVTSRNLCLAPSTDNKFWMAVRKQGIEEKLRAANTPIILQGELIGPGVQSNKLKLNDLDIRFFNVRVPGIEVDILGLSQMQATLKSIDLKSVPIIDSEFKLDHSVDQLVAMATRKSSINSETWCEGLVFRPTIPTQDPELGRLSFKAINPEFLIKYGE